MSQPRIALEEASAAQLSAFATIVQGIEVGARENRASLLAKITESGWSRPDIPVLAPATNGPASPAPGVGNRRPRVKADGSPWIQPETGEQDWEVCILIPEQATAGGSEPVFVSVNGRAMYIPRAQPHYVPEAYVEVLRNATELQYEANGDHGLGEPRAVPLIPFSYA